MNETWTLSWAAGLFEGEGSIGFTNRTIKGRTYTYPRLQLGMTDEDVIRGFLEVVGSGRINGPYGHARGKPYWQWSAENAQGRLAYERLRPFFGTRRKERGLEVFGE